jgi:hypothetical protein
LHVARPGSTTVRAIGDDRQVEDLDALRDEVIRLRRENEQLRGVYRVPARASTDKSAPARAVRVLLLPDPAAPAEPGRPGPRVVLGMAEVLIAQLCKRQPDVDWRAEGDLDRIPPGAACFQPSEVLRRMWSGSGPLPKTYRIDDRDDGQRGIKRCLVEGDAESDRFCAAYEEQLAVVDELLAEGQVAHAAGAQHHAAWTLKAVDVVLARTRLALATFEAGRDHWKTELDASRPEYEPRYSVTSEHPPGW